MNGQSLDIIKDKIEQLKQIIPEAFTENKIDWEKFKVLFGEQIEFKNERYHLNWAGKSAAYRMLQAPSYKTLKPCRSESINFDETENLFIEGDNLEVLKILQKAYFGKIKMIYIDPPYNTGNDFIYKDDFSENLREYRKRTGEIDENGNATRAGLFRNTKENGQYHSNWLNMMLPRLFLAKTLLRDDGVIFISIDDNEIAQLKILMDEIFGEENFIGNIIWNSTKSNTNTQIISVSHTYDLIYCKNIEFYKINRNEFRLPETGYGFVNPDNDPRGPWKADPFQVGGWRPNQQYEIINPKTGEKFRPNPGCSWKNDYNTFLKLLNDNRIVFGKTGNSGPQRKRFLYEAIERGRVVNTWWDDIDTTSQATLQLKNLFGSVSFNNPKPVSLIRKFLQLCTKHSDIILDFFAGSGTTAHAVMELNKEDGGNRKFILVQLPEETDADSEAFKAGYKTIAEIAKERIRRVAKKIQSELDEEKQKKSEQLQLGGDEPEKKLDLGFKVFKLDESNFKQWRPFVPQNAEEIKQSAEDFIDIVLPSATIEDMLYELMLKNGKKLTDKIEKKSGFFAINGNELVVLLESVEKTVIDEVLSLAPQKVIALDRLFEGNDQLKTNIVLQFKDAGIEFKSV